MRRVLAAPLRAGFATSIYAEVAIFRQDIIDVVGIGELWIVFAETIGERANYGYFVAGSSRAILRNG